jgi:hypothetical protein
MAKLVVFAGSVRRPGDVPWMSLSHPVFPLGGTGAQETVNEPAVLNAMQAALGEKSGLYLFLGTGVGPDRANPQKNAAMNRMIRSWRSTRPVFWFTIRRMKQESQPETNFGASHRTSGSLPGGGAACPRLVWLASAVASPL